MSEELQMKQPVKLEELMPKLSEQVQKAASERGYRIGDHPSFVCMDDRSDDVESAALPGGGAGQFGIAMLAAERALAKTPMNDDQRDALYESLHKSTVDVFGETSFHSDDRHKDNHSVCAGCGFMAYVMKQLSPRGAAFLESKLSLASGYMPIYQGDHTGKAVVYISGNTFSMPTNLGDGERAYRINETIWHERLEDLAGETFSAIQAISPMTGALWQENVASMADECLGAVAQNLGADKLPAFKVSLDKNQKPIVRAM